MPPWNSASSGARRLKPQRSDVATVALHLSPELRRRKAAVEVEWCAKRWRSNARQVLRGGFSPADAGARRQNDTRDEASVIGNLAALLLQQERDSAGGPCKGATGGARGRGALSLP